jgi:hypothetical protein
MASVEPEAQVRQATQQLLAMARTLTWNGISDNCVFILSEIQDSQDNLHVQRRNMVLENKAKHPQPLQAILLDLSRIFSESYDINFYIFRAERKRTIIDVRFYSKSALTTSFRQQVADNPSMLHAKVTLPLHHQKGKFDINWAYHEVSDWLRPKWLHTLSRQLARFLAAN